MDNRYYVLNVTLTSKETETRTITPYDDYVVALRKFHENLTGIGTGSKRICVALFDTYLNTIKKESWAIPEPEPEPTPEPTPEPENTEGE
jgi:hypothetical protein